MEALKLQGLEIFGDVLQCEEIGKDLHITLGKGFSINANDTMKFWKFLAECGYPIIKKMVTDKDSCVAILSKN